MLCVCHRSLVAATVLLLLSAGANATTITAAPKATPTATSSTPETCEFRTINYITDSLPQFCLRSSWSSTNTTSVKTVSSGDASMTAEGTVREDLTDSTANIVVDGAQSAGSEAITTTEYVSSTSTTTVQTPEATVEATATDLETGELNDASFLSFEEWKKQTLEKAGQANANIGNRRSGENKKRDYEGLQNNLESVGDEGEIDIDLTGVFSGGKAEEKALSENGFPKTHDTEREVEVARRKDQHMSKDAGKTCKERFSYASFDAGATILKTHQGAKNSKAVLIENKDSYMLSECTTENKFVIIELSEDIWIDTVVLANYEFFSSMIRTFRVSLSDRYPVKPDKWKEAGTYEARNSRDIQAFLIANPQIWARYIRIEFLSHYGNEYYCPLSLVRVHGTRMLESWKESEAIDHDNDEEEESDSEGEEQFNHEAVAQVVQETERLKAVAGEVAKAVHEAAAEQARNDSHEAEMRLTTTPWTPTIHIFDVIEEKCLSNEAPLSDPPIMPESTIENSNIPMSNATQISSSSPPWTSTEIPTIASRSITSARENSVTVDMATAKENWTTTVPTFDTTSTASNTHAASSLSNSNSSVTATKTQNTTSSVKNKTTGTSSGSSALPTIQESFFKAVSRRLNFLESNSTLSLKYIEEQSKALRDAFMKVEKKQTQRTTVFLDTLNSTVLQELRQIRQQYDEIWQSTVISLESQRDESRRENLALSSRLNILADEVVFQKRMSIVQSVLLLLCLGLVIFSRVSASGNFDFPNFPQRARHMSSWRGFNVESPTDGIESPPQSPDDYVRPHTRQWSERGHRRRESDETAGLSRSRDQSPATPISTYSQSDDLTPQSGADDMHKKSNDQRRELAESLDLPQPSRSVSSASYHSAGDAPVSSFPPPQTEQTPQLLSSPQRTPEKRKALMRSQLRTSNVSFSSPIFTTEDSPRQQYDGEGDSPHAWRGHRSSPSGLSRSRPDIPDIGLTLPSPPPESTESARAGLSISIQHQEQEQQNQEDDHHRRQSFSIARKPLPSLPHPDSDST